MKPKKAAIEKLSKKSQDEFLGFENACLSWGWESDQGTGSKVDESQKTYQETRESLAKRILYLERQIAKLKGKK